MLIRIFLETPTTPFFVVLKEKSIYKVSSINCVEYFRADNQKNQFEWGVKEQMHQKCNLWTIFLSILYVF